LELASFKVDNVKGRKALEGRESPSKLVVF
jgi:hypothetical protein